MEEAGINRILRTLRHRERGDGVEVEHLLKLVHHGDASLVAALQALSKECHWHAINNQRHVPLASWVDIVCDYLSGGIPAMLEIAWNGAAYSEFALGVLEELSNQSSAEALVTLLDVFDPQDESALPFIRKLIYTFNLVVSLGKGITLSEGLREKACTRLFAMLEHADRQQDNALCCTCIGSFRGVGSLQIIPDLLARKPMPYPYQGIEKKVVREIRKRASACT